MFFFKRHQCLDGFGQAEIQEVALDTVSRILKLNQSPVRTQTKVPYSMYIVYGTGTHVLALNHLVKSLVFYCLMA
jgi:hypothetical protein